MIAVILAAGTGSRLMPLTRDIPKTLLKIQEITLLERMVQNCIFSGIQEYIIVVGHKKEKVFEEIEYLKQKYGIKIDTVENKKYDQTNTSFSVFLATKSLDDEVMIINGDNVVDANIINGLTKLEKTALVVDNHKELNHESFKLRIEDNVIMEIGKGIDIQTSTGEFIGISKVIREDLPLFNEILENLISEDVQNYYDLAYKELSKKSTIDYFFTDGLKWTEIDDKDDWEYAKIIIEEIKSNN
ncbi:MAG: phosphocholine cytidylyltransferase family protein [Methanobacteriaceae archaeon]